MLLPADAVRMLVAASKIDAEIPPGGSFNRTREIDKAIELIRDLYPHLFCLEDNL